MIPMYVWLRWKLGHKEFKPYGRSNPAVRPNVGFGGKGQSPVPKRWWDELKLRWPTRNPFPLTVNPADFFVKGVGFGTAWGMWNGQFVDRLKVEAGTVTAADLRPFLLKLKARGATYVCVQDAIYTRQMRDALKQACHELGLKLAVWEWTRDWEQTRGLISYWAPDAYVANVEHEGPWEALASGVATQYPALPRAVWTNFAGAGALPDGSYSIEAARVWWGNGFVCITEAYLQEASNLTPETLDWVARVKLGYPDVVASPGIYSGKSLESYLGMPRVLPAYLVYLAEHLPEFP